MSSDTGNPPSITQNVKGSEKKMTIPEALGMLSSFFHCCGYNHGIFVDRKSAKRELSRWSTTGDGLTWSRLRENAEVYTRFFPYLDYFESSMLELFISELYALNGQKEVSEKIERLGRFVQCKYCWKYVLLEGKGKFGVCEDHNVGSRHPEIRKIMRNEKKIFAIRSKVLHHIHVAADNLHSGVNSISVNIDACPYLSKLMGCRPCSPQEMYKLLEFDPRIDRIETYELIWAMASFEAWHQAHTRAAVGMPEPAPETVAKITDELWVRCNKTEGAPPF